MSAPRLTDPAVQHARDRERIEALEREVDELRELVRKFEQDRFGTGWLAPLELRLTASENRVVATLMVHSETVSKQQLMDALYALRPDDEPEQKIVDVFVCKLRRKLKPWGIAIETRWGQGYSMSAESRERLKNWRSAA